MKFSTLLLALWLATGCGTDASYTRTLASENGGSLTSASRLPSPHRDEHHHHVDDI